MLISCKCLNFIASSNNQQKQKQHLPNTSQQQLELPAATSAAVATADSKEKSATAAAVAMQQLSNDCNNSVVAMSSNNNLISKARKDDDCNNSLSLTNVLRKTFIEKYPRSFIFYSLCVDFFKQAIGPVSDLAINTLSQRDIIYSFTLDINEPENTSLTPSSWQLSICSNCNVVLCAKLLNSNSSQFLINCGLLTNNEELSQKISEKSFSDTFGLLIMDHHKLETSSYNQSQNVAYNLTIGSLSTSSANSHHLDSKQLRLRQLHAILQQRLQREIAETDDRIQRYTSQQFALLKSFREKSEQEYQMLVALIQCIPEQQANEWLDRQPPALEVSNNGVNLSYGGTRRRNTVSGRREINNTATTPTTPTAIQPPFNIFSVNKENYVKNGVIATPSSPKSAITTTATINTVVNNTVASSGHGIASAITPTIVGNSSASNRKVSNFDTPPATPEAIPMSVGNSPTFRQQQQLASFANPQQALQNQFPTPNIETADDCLFELEEVDNNSTEISQQQEQSSTIYLQNASSPLQLLQSQHQHLQPQKVPDQILPPYNTYHRSLSYLNPHQGSHMSDLDDSDDAEEAEDALDLDNSMPISTPHRRINSKSAAQVANFAKSLPIEISHSPLAVGRGYMSTLESDEDDLDNNVDIAASIKALAKSVHGEAVFGDLPRPRLRSQI